MGVQKVTFKNRNNQQLSAKLEFPDNQPAHNYAVFAHCFTCNKNLLAIRNISRALNKEGIAVLRFDFTGLGESEGDFIDTNFSSNINGLIDAAKFVKENYQAPSIIIGHSLGGAAAIFAAKQIESVKAVATIGAPSSPDHVQHLFGSDISEIEKDGVAKISISGREFNLAKQFIDDIESKSMEACIKSLRKPLLVIHSPQDIVVGIQNAKEIYSNAFHPKSFISIDGADHMLSNKKDSNYVGGVIAGWVGRYIDVPEETDIKTKHQVAVSLGNEGYTTEVVAGNHKLISDEPESVGGNDFGPAPYDFVLSGLGACTAMTLRMYAERKQWDLDKVIVHLDHEKELIENKKVDIFTRNIQIFGDLDVTQKKRLIEIANKCPVHKTLHNSSIVKTNLKS
jgi:putative redox protein